jgi:uncharacterized protein (DUF1499 family)
VLFALLILMAGGMAYVRLASDDPARWHVPVAPAGGECVVQAANAARARLHLPGVGPAEVLARLDGIALATPRTLRLAGGPAEGRVTWVTRSRLFGFPDYTTAEARADGADTVLTLHARARYGRGDMGVNAARLKDWIARLGAP